jgi:hypothetical protein
VSVILHQTSGLTECVCGDLAAARNSLFFAAYSASLHFRLYLVIMFRLLRGDAAGIAIKIFEVLILDSQAWNSRFSPCGSKRGALFACAR